MDEMVSEFVTTDENTDYWMWELLVVFKVLRGSQNAVQFGHGSCDCFCQHYCWGFFAFCSVAVSSLFSGRQ